MLPAFDHSCLNEEADVCTTNSTLGRSRLQPVWGSLVKVPRGAQGDGAVGAHGHTPRGPTTELTQGITGCSSRLCRDDGTAAQPSRKAQGKGEASRGPVTWGKGLALDLAVGRGRGVPPVPHSRGGPRSSERTRGTHNCVWHTGRFPKAGLVLLLIHKRGNRSLQRGEPRVPEPVEELRQDPGLLAYP